MTGKRNNTIDGEATHADEAAGEMIPSPLPPVPHALSPAALRMAISGAPDPMSVWERQPYDTELSYESFQKDYLALPKPRTYTDAYRRYCARLGKKAPEVDRETGKIEIVTFFDRWTKGVDSGYRKPVGSRFEYALTWKQRAMAFDAHLERAAIERRQERALTVADTEWRMGEMLEKRLAQIMEDVPVTVTNPTEGDIVKLADAISKLKRRSSGMPLETVVVETWRHEATQQGLDPEQLFEQVIEHLTRRLTTQSDGDGGTALEGPA